MLSMGLAALTVIGALQVLAGWVAVVRFARAPLDLLAGSPLDLLAGSPPDRFAGSPPDAARGAEPISVLKPLYGDEPLLAEALATLCEQDYPAGWQIVFGVHGEDDAAVPVVRALRARFPERDIVLVADATEHGSNPKVGNLINMLPAARHDILVIADSDVHARPDYLRRLSETLARPNAGIATTLYTGLPAWRTLASLLGTTQITHGFLPGALLARALGRRDCLGATMALRRETLSRIGGFAALKDHLADDNVLGQLVIAAGLDVALAHTIVATTVPEQTIGALWRHEERWARTIRTLAPAAFAAAVLQYPLCLALLTLLAAEGAIWAWILAAGVWVCRALAVTGIDHALAPMLGGLAFRCPLWLLPLRDLLSAAEWVVSHAGRRVDWRGQSMLADTPGRPTAFESTSSGLTCSGSTPSGPTPSGQTSFGPAPFGPTPPHTARDTSPGPSSSLSKGSHAP